MVKMIYKISKIKGIFTVVFVWWSLKEETGKDQAAVAVWDVVAFKTNRPGVQQECEES